MDNKFISEFDYSTKQLKNSLLRYRLSVFYRKINLDKINFFDNKKTYNAMARIMTGLEDMINFHDSIKNIVLVLNHNNYELYMLGNNSFSKMLEDKGMIILKYALSTKHYDADRKRKSYTENDSNDKLKKYKPNPKIKSSEIIKNELKTKRFQTKTNSVDNNLIEKFKNLSEKEKNDLLLLLNKNSNKNDINDDKSNNINHIIEKIEDTNSSDELIFIDKIGEKVIENEKDIIISEPSLGEIVVNNEDIPIQKSNIREKRIIKKVLRYEQEFC